MIKRRVILYLLCAFFAGNVLLIVIQYITAQKTHILIAGNIKLLNEINVTSDLKELEIDISAVDDNSRKRFPAKDSLHIIELESQIGEVKSDIVALQKISDDDSTEKYVDVLDTLVHHKLLLSRDFFNIDYAGDGTVLPDIRINRQVKDLNDSIVSIIHKIDSSRMKLWQKVTLANDESGRQALMLGNVLIGVVLFIGAIIFWYIINIMRRQNQLINQLNISEQNERASAKIKENFLANMSHEIRTPLNAIVGFTSLLQRRPLDQESCGYVKIIEKSGENLLEIVNDILDLSKIEAGMIRIVNAPFSITGVLHAIAAMFKEKAAEKQIALTVFTAELVPKIVEGDAGRLTQILVNLVGNALKFTHRGSITISAESEKVPGETIHIFITVKDTGIGIEAAKLQTIFERFRQGEDAVTRQYGGTGLGLSIVNELVVLQNGTIQADSKPGIGSTFTIMIPYRLSSANGNKELTEPGISLSETGLNNYWILVAEDNVMNQTLIKHLFKEWQLNVDVVSNGAAAIKALEKKVYQLVLMDIQMPEMDGYTAAGIIRNKLYLNLPVIAMTAHAMEGEREKCLRYGMNDYISKPIREQQLHEMIRHYIKPVTVTVTTTENNAPNSYRCIDLTYMKQVSLGNREYEKVVTEQFIAAVPGELAMLEKAWRKSDLQSFRHVAHNLKTTISVMGLDEKLHSILDAFEYEVLSQELFEQNFTALHDMLTTAVKEANQFYETL